MRVTTGFYIVTAMVLLGLSNPLSAQQDELNFKVSNSDLQKDNNLSDSIFFSIREAVVFPAKVKELSL